MYPFPVTVTGPIHLSVQWKMSQDAYQVSQHLSGPGEAVVVVVVAVVVVPTDVLALNHPWDLQLHALHQSHVLLVKALMEDTAAGTAADIAASVEVDACLEKVADSFHTCLQMLVWILEIPL